MKKIIITLFLICNVVILQSQSNEIEKEIKALEQAEVKAVLEKDSVMLMKLWDKNFVVNNPDNRVVFAGNSTLDRPVMRHSRVFFSREVEHVIVKGDIVFSMGSETLIPSGENNLGGQTIRRRYTNVWIRENGSWKLMARHANVICQN